MENAIDLEDILDESKDRSNSSNSITFMDTRSLVEKICLVCMCQYPKGHAIPECKYLNP